MLRKENSHKGDNGRVLVVGGGELYHGAVILAGLGAEKSGADQVYLIVPVNQKNIARNFSLNLIVDDFSGKFLRSRDVSKIIERSDRVDVITIGNGLGERAQTVRACKQIISKSNCDLVLDATALRAFSEMKNPTKKRQIVMTPHRGEFAKMIKRDLTVLEEIEIRKIVRQYAIKNNVIIVLKGSNDYIADNKGNFHINKSGHPIMSKGGTGDILAGLIGGLMAQGLSGYEASKEATNKWGKVGEDVARKQGLLVTVKELLDNYK